ncbi:MAG: hypothetical protein IAF38_16955, partial [Bacteroidia bacterium]|nr:hypothetical protein [Bacteroidia bacterium]
MSEQEAVQIYFSIKQLLEVESDNFKKSELIELEKKYAVAVNQLKKFRLEAFTVFKTKLLCDIFEKINEEMKPSTEGKITLAQGIENDYGLILK